MVSNDHDTALLCDSFPQFEDMAFECVGATSTVLCASPAYLASHGVPDAISELHSHRCLQLKHIDDAPEQFRFEGLAIFQFESGFNPNNGNMSSYGTGTKLFGRQAYVGLAHDAYPGPPQAALSRDNRLPAQTAGRAKRVEPQLYAGRAQSGVHLGHHVRLERRRLVVS